MISFAQARQALHRGGKTLKTLKTLEPLHAHAGFVAPRYRKASRTADALLEAGRTLLRTQTSEALTIHDLCRAAGVTTGAFYGRFEGKDVFLGALLAVTARDVHDRMQEKASELTAAPGLREGMRVLLRELRRLFLRHAGVLRASLLQAGGQEAWGPFRQRREAFVEQVLPALEQLAGTVPSEALRQRIRFGFQVVFGTLMNAMLNAPGPITLASRRLDEELTEVFCAYVERCA